VNMRREAALWPSAREAREEVKAEYEAKLRAALEELRQLKADNEALKSKLGMSLDKRRDVEKLASLAGMMDDLGAHATADILDMAALQVRDRSARGSLMSRIVGIANDFDSRGDHLMADAMDKAAEVVSSEEAATVVKPGNMIPLSSRYCPDHRGVQTFRVDENARQCPIDGRIYNYETGYSDYAGMIVPGGSVAGQTESATPYAVPHRIFDTRENILNAIH